MVICDFFSSFVFFDSLVSSHNILIYPSSSTIVEAFLLQSSLRIKYTLLVMVITIACSALFLPISLTSTAHGRSS
jgi:hypothetical protein